MKTLVKRFCYKGHTYTIVSDNGYTLAIDHRYLDEKGCLKEKLNGLQMFVSMDDQSVSGIMGRIKYHHDFNEYLKENGYEHGADFDPDKLRELILKFNKNWEVRA